MTDSTLNNMNPELRRIGHYQLLDCIGRGGMGLVYRARDTRLERDVAVKCLRTELFEGHYIERFKREALLLAKLNHSNIVQIYDFIETPEQLALVMELVEGQNLQIYLREHIVSIAQRLQWLVQITEGLALAHDEGIIHRDLKAENILINQRGQAKITDLGIAKSEYFSATITDHVAGSYCSMSPEQAVGETVTFKSDLFSLGILAYQLLCGAHPFGDTGNKLQTMQRIISHPPTPPQQHNPDLPGELIDLLGQLLSKNPDKRPDNTHWIAAQFARLKGTVQQHPLPGDDTEALVQIPPQNKSLHTWDHPTFDTRFIPTRPNASLWQKIKSYLAANKIAASSAAVSFLILAGLVVWQLQPKPPRYVAVIPPKLVAEGMQESQQELIKNAIYEAIQQGIIQLDQVYLIPRVEITDIQGGLETIGRATGADELVTTDIRCNPDTCSITLSRLTTQELSNEMRLAVKDTATVDVLTDNYLSIADITTRNLEKIYREKIVSQKGQLQEEEYTKLLQINQQFRKEGGNKELLESFKAFSPAAKNSAMAQSLYSDIALEVYYHTNDVTVLGDLETFLSTSKEGYLEEKIRLYNLYLLSIAEYDLEKTQKNIDQLLQLNISNTEATELNANFQLNMGNYDAAIQLYNSAIKLRPSLNSFYSLALCYWHKGNIPKSKEYLEKVAQLSREFYKTDRLYGAIALTEGNLTDAIKYYTAIISRNPQDISGLNNLGITYLLSADFDNAQVYFQKAHELAPDNRTILLNIADVQNLSGQKTEAENLYKSIAANQTSAEDRETLRNVTQAKAQLGDYKGAITNLRLLQKIDPDNVDTMYTSALVYTLAGDLNSAILEVENALKNNMHPLWFSFHWFHPLCKTTDFTKLFTQHINQNTTQHPLENICPDPLP